MCYLWIVQRGAHLRISLIWKKRFYLSRIFELNQNWCAVCPVESCYKSIPFVSVSARVKAEWNLIRCLFKDIGFEIESSTVIQNLQIAILTHARCYWTRRIAEGSERNEDGEKTRKRRKEWDGKKSIKKIDFIFQIYRYSVSDTLHNIQYIGPSDMIRYDTVRERSIVEPISMEVK